jgi:hypothetical protein
MNRLKSVLASAAVLTFATMNEGAAADGRSYVPGYFALELDGGKSGLIKSVEGGAITGEVVQSAHGFGLTKKHIANVKYEQFSLEAGFGEPKELLDWVSATVDGNGQRKDGSIFALDARLNEGARRNFRGGLITEITFPACDAASKEATSMNVKIAPELIESLPGSGKNNFAVSIKKQKQWLPSNFRLEIPGVDCSKVKKVDAITIKQPLLQHSVGEPRSFGKVPGTLEISNLRVTVPASYARDFVGWHNDFVINGNNDDSKEKTGTLSFLSLDRKEELVKLTFFNLGIFRVENSSASGGSDNVATVVIDLYVERMEVDFMAQFE